MKIHLYPKNRDLIRQKRDRLINMARAELMVRDHMTPHPSIQRSLGSANILETIRTEKKKKL